MINSLTLPFEPYNEIHTHPSVSDVINVSPRLIRRKSLALVVKILIKHQTLIKIYLDFIMGLPPPSVVTEVIARNIRLPLAN